MNKKDKNSPPLIGLIPAAGKGIRARPYTQEVHKGLFNINGSPNIERIITIMRDDLQIVEIVIVVGYLGNKIKAQFGDGKKMGVSIRYIDNENLNRGWAWSVFLAKKYIDQHFCVMLCDECYIRSNHRDLLAVDYQNKLAVCAGMHVDDVLLIKKNYSIEKQHNLVTQLIEKPQVVSNDLMGSGTFLFSPEIFTVLEKTFNEKVSVDLVSLLNEQIVLGSKIGFFELTGTYININDRDSLQLAKYHDRINRFNKYTASLLIVSEGQEEDIAFTINRYKELKLFQQIAVVVPQTNAIQKQVESMAVDLIVCPITINNFGERIHYGLTKLKGDILVMTEADYSFAVRDVEKLFTYLKEADMVIGTRTTRQLIEQGSTMRGVLRMAHTALGKLLEVLWWQREGRFTDVGCTFRVLWRTTYEQIEPELSSTGAEFLAEMVIASLNQRQRVLEIPVNYFNRSVAQNRIHRNPATFFRVLFFIFKRRWQLLIKPKNTS